LSLSVIPFMSIEIFQLFCAAVFAGSLLGLAFVTYKIVIEEQEKKLEKSRVKVHWRDRRKQTGQPRGD